MFIAFLTTKHLRVHMNSFKRVRTFQNELEFGSVGFEERGKPEYPEKNLSEQGREPTTNSTRIWRQRWDLNQGHIGGRRALSPLRHPCSPWWRDNENRELSELHHYIGRRKTPAGYEKLNKL